MFSQSSRAPHTSDKSSSALYSAHRAAGARTENCLLHICGSRCCVSDNTLLNLLVHLSAVIPMKAPRVGRWVSALTIGVVCCLAASGPRLVRGGERESNVSSSGRLLASADGTTETCGSSPLKLSGADTSFKFKCQTGAKLVPAEASGNSGKTVEYTKVYQFTPSSTRSDPQCGGAEQTLASIVPRSSLVKGPEATAQLAGVQDVFTLKLGPAQEVDKHLCYICTPASDGGVISTAENQGKAACTVYVTVPRKDNPEGPTDKPSDSGSFSPSVFGWLTLILSGSAWEFMFHM